VRESSSSLEGGRGMEWRDAAILNGHGLWPSAVLLVVGCCVWSFVVVEAWLRDADGA
jgi:hypothetical protein